MVLVDNHPEEVDKEGLIRTMDGYLLAEMNFPLLSTTQNCLSTTSPVSSTAPNLLAVISCTWSTAMDLTG